MRKCRRCKTELKRRKDCEDQVQRGGFCSYTCLAIHGREKAEQQRERQRKKERKEIRHAKRQLRENDKKHQTTLTRQVFNRFIRLLDEGKPCISCGEYKCGREWHAGHFKAVGGHPELRFDPRNCHLQGAACNEGQKRRGRNDDTVSKEYEKRLRERYGDAMVDWCNGSHDPKHYTVDDLKAIRALFREESKRLENGEGPSRDWRSLDYDVLELARQM